LSLPSDLTAKNCFLCRSWCRQVYC